MRLWICFECGQEVLSPEGYPPLPLKWTDGHECKFIRQEETKKSNEKENEHD